MIIIKAQFPSSEMWIRALEHGDPYAFVAVLLSQLHRTRQRRVVKIEIMYSQAQREEHVSSSSLEAQLATRKCGRLRRISSSRHNSPRQKCGFVPWNTVTHTHLWLYFYLRQLPLVFRFRCWIHQFRGDHAHMVNLLSQIWTVVATSRGLQVSSESSLYHRVDIDWTRPPLKRVLIS
jgi:hypothetical protein